MNTTYVLIGLAVLAIALFIVAIVSKSADKETTIIVENNREHHPYNPEQRPWWHWW